MTCHLQEPGDTMNNTEVHQSNQENELVVEPEEDVIDIDDSTASGRLSALRKKWLQTQERKITPETNYPSAWTRS